VLAGGYRRQYLSLMSETASTMLALGTAAPDFRLPDTNGKVVSLQDFAGSRALLVAFLCNHCPYVRHIRPRFVELARDLQSQGVAVVAISPNDIRAYPEDGPQRMAEEARRSGFSFPYLYDEPQEVAKAYHAACTPDFFLFDEPRLLVYRGQMDDSRPGNGKPVTGRDLLEAVKATLAGGKVSGSQRPSVGCSIKWKQGNEPGYLRVR
jgi:peroxiredoxin